MNDKPEVDKRQETSVTQLGLGKHRGLLEEFWHNYKKNKLSLIGGVIVITFLIIALFAPLISPYNPVEQFGAPSGEHHPLRPLSKGEEGRFFLFGTDRFGRDILSRTFFGCRTLFELAVGSIAVALLIGVTMGAVAGYNNGNWIDETIMRVVDIMISFPTLVLAIALLGAFGIGKMKIGPITISNMIKIMIVIAITYSPRFARVMRGVVLQEMGEDYVDAAKMAGASSGRVLVNEIFVNTIPPIIVQASLMMATTILTSASLSFLGLGLQPPIPSLGIMLNESRDFLFIGAWWYAVIPGLFISTIILGFNLLGDGLRDSLDPKQARKVGHK
ncbi:MAG: ABC transporter permease [Candidatus Bipolaricaulota bacterium]|nr:ABC transporter permease [Candidatus Bipolaricaulota bacterium]